MTCVDGIAKGVAAAESETVFDELAARLAPFVPFDASIFFGTDPATVLPMCPARIDGVANNQCHAYWQREFLVEDVNLFADLARAPLPTGTLWSATDGLPARSARYRDFLKPEGFGDELRVAFRVARSPRASPHSCVALAGRSSAGRRLRWSPPSLPRSAARCGEQRSAGLRRRFGHQRRRA